MNEVIRKCVEELNKETPKLDYIRGMLDTILAMSEPTKTDVKISAVSFTPANKLPEETIDEAALIDAQARAAIETVQALNTPDE